jgi:peptidoglycan/LPS O-acetylase OafA/YrhL
MTCFPWLLVFTRAGEKLLGFGETLPLPVWLALFAGVVPVAAVAHHLVERPARTALRRWGDAGFPGPNARRAATRPA